ncbi:hypothetical protein G210_0901 [Candida maltosa Xu316]|uniref:Major facilitator superfamily (MFS) profile domain-containing protein n=1 Tax=Candida maltosa (strain Xu316) TaxID=1245528 RepID=M3IPZ3_CANMX|nr:hypothetical protein G210_0901 [Candida maltosa Xu316]
MHGGNLEGSEIQKLIVEKRLGSSAKPGISAIIKNKRSFMVGLFTALGGVLYGYNQGMFGQISGMHSFSTQVGIGQIQDNPTLQGLLTSILELGAWVGVLANGYFADKFGRRGSVVIGSILFIIGVIVQAVAHGGNYDYILGGRFVIGLGVGVLSTIVPLFNAEISAPETRGTSTGIYQGAITFGIMISYWITYGTNFIGGTGENQSQAAWLVPMCIQLLPAVLFATCIYFFPESPRWLIMVGREDEALENLAWLREADKDDVVLRMEFLEMKAQKIFEDTLSSEAYPHLQDGSFSSRFKMDFNQYKSMLTHRPTFRRVSVAALIMIFQQWTGVNFVLYYAPFIFASLGLSGQTTSLLASGVVGIVMFVCTIPAILWVDKVGRKPLLISGAIIMGICHFIVAGIIGSFEGSFDVHMGAGWAAVVFVWIFAAAFGYSWPCAWVVVAEVFPLGMRSKGVSIGGSFNWLMNFSVAMSTPKFVASAHYGAYIFLGLMCIFGALYVFFLVPETKNKTLDELDEVFGDFDGTSRKEAELHERIIREVGLVDLLMNDSDSFGSKGELDVQEKPATETVEHAK